MPASTSEILNLRAAPRPSCALDPLVERLLGLIASGVENADSPAVVSARQRVEQLCATLRGRQEGWQDPSLTDEIVALCATLVDSGGPLQRVAQELAAAVTLVSEAIRIMSADERKFGQALSATAVRFDGLRHTPDIESLRAGLALEVETLRQVVLAREAQWQLRIEQVETKLRTLEDRLAESQLQATHDPLTGVVNRRTVERCFKGYASSRRSFILALLDLDNFKAINDVLGHLTGDEALRAVADTLKSGVRPHDVVGRFGGDEFVVLMVDVTLKQAEYRFTTLLRTLQGLAYSTEQTRPLTASAGLAEFSAGDSFEGLLKRADHALYDAKRAGRNRVVSRTAPFIKDLKTR